MGNQALKVGDQVNELMNDGLHFVDICTYNGSYPSRLWSTIPLTWVNWGGIYKLGTFGKLGCSFWVTN